MNLVCLTGPESTGKTTLAAELARKFGGVWLPEYSRSLLDSSECNERELLTITHEQAAREINFVDSTPSVGIIDTDFVNIRIWWEVQFGYIPDEVDEHIETQAERSYLLLSPDIPWVFDKLRNRQTDREFLFRKHLEVLDQFGFNYLIVRGEGIARTKCAVSASTTLLNRQTEVGLD